MPGFKHYEGTWRQYIHINKKNVMLYPDDAEYENMASSFVNPLTVCYFWHLVKTTGVKAVIQDAACSSLGKMFMRLCQAKDIQVINVVRKESQARQLEDLGARYVLNSSDEDYEDQLDQTINSVNPRAFFD